MGQTAYFEGVGDQYETLIIGAIEFEKEVHYLVGGLAVQVAGGFIGPDDGRLVDQGAGR